MSTITELAGKAAPFSARIAHADAGEACLLMFSGGRDSTLAALRLHHGRVPLRLVTVTSSHLTGINLVRRRLSELSKILPATTPWLNIRQPVDLKTDTSFRDPHRKDKAASLGLGSGQCPPPIAS